MSKVQEIIEKQRKFFDTGVTKDIKFRRKYLDLLEKNILKIEGEISQALYKDLSKSEFEAFMSEISMVISEIHHMKKKVGKYSRTKIKMPNITHVPAIYKEYTEPYGVVLIMSPWNYPFLLTILPLVDAIAAGNTAIVKPSAYSHYSSEIIKKLIDMTFDEEYVYTALGGRDVNSELLDLNYDYIFFTGGIKVGTIIMEKASQHLTPVSLELGGKSPCIVDDTAKIDLAAKRIVFGKFTNAGQTCIAPDYFIVKKGTEDQLVESLVKYIKLTYGKDPTKNDIYPKIINEKHFNRINNLINKDKVVYGGYSNKENHKIAPTIMKNITLDDPVMKEEIFGPLIPILSYENENDIKKIISNFGHPLAFYVFSEDKDFVARLHKYYSFGGGCVNDALMHIATSKIGFGGVGPSGMGSYHGKYGFDTFSHKKGVVKRYTIADVNIRYLPGTKSKMRLLRRIFKIK